MGRNVSRFKPGDEVFGVAIRYPQGSGAKLWICQGAFAEYVCAPESALAIKPDNVTFEQAAAAPVAAFPALQGWRDKGHVQPGQKALVNGAAGGVGTFAVLTAKSFGAHVTGVCSTRNLEMVRSIGADRVIDYAQEDFTRSGRSYDVLFDLIGNRSLSACRRVLRPKGYFCWRGARSRWMIGLMARPLKGLVLSPFVSQKLVMFLARPNKDDFTIMRELMQAGKSTSVIDRRYKLHEVPEAIRYLETKHARGKVVITL